MFVPRKVKQVKQIKPKKQQQREEEEHSDAPSPRRRRLSKDPIISSSVDSRVHSYKKDSSVLPASQQGSSCAGSFATASSSRVVLDDPVQCSRQREQAESSSSRPQVRDRSSVLLLFQLLSPPTLLWCAARSHPGVCEFIEHIKQVNSSCGADSDVGESSENATSIHISRLSRLLSSFADDVGWTYSATQVKKLRNLSIVSNLSSALQDLVDAGISWFRLSEDGFRVHLSQSYLTAILQQKYGEVTQRDRIVYLESIPPDIEDTVQAAGFVQGLLRHHQQQQNPHPESDGNQTQEEWTVYAVFEPTDPASRKSGRYPPPTSRSVGWIPGRAFVLLSHAEACTWLSERFPWQLDRRMFKSDMVEKRDGETEKVMEHAWTLRCLRLEQWLELKGEYLELQLRARQLVAEANRKGESAPASATNGDSSTEVGEGQAKGKNDEQFDLKVSETEANGDHAAVDSQTQKQKGPWYRGTVLELHLPHSDSSNPSVESLKQELERKVPESIAYIHTQSPADNIPADADATVVIVRTKLPAQATALLRADSRLQRMQPKEEDTYYGQLPEKVRKTAEKRVLASLEEQGPDTTNSKDGKMKKRRKAR